MMTSWATFTPAGRGIGEQAVLSAFHQLRRAYLETDEGSRQVYTQEDYTAFLDRQEARIRDARTRGHITERQEQSLLARLSTARSEPMPEQSQIYAMRNLVPAVRNRESSLRTAANNIAIRTARPVNEVLEQMRRDARGHTSRNTQLSSETMDRAVALGLPRDTGTVYAWSLAEAEAQRAEIVVARQEPQRIRRAEVTSDFARQTRIPAVTVTEVGYDARNGRLEVVVEDGATGERAMHAYRNVPDSVAQSVLGNPGSGWASQIRGNTDYQYPDEHTEALDGVAPRCPNCGQFADASHACQVQANPEVLSAYDRGTRWTVQSRTVFGVDERGDLQQFSAGVRLPAIRRLQQAVNSTGGARLDFNRWESIALINDDGNWVNGRITGSMNAYRDDDGNLQVGTGNAQCSCAQYQRNGHCPHVDFVEQAIRDRIERPNATARQAAEQAEQQRAVQAAATRVERMAAEARASDWTTNPAALEEARQAWRADSEVLYSENPAAFEEDVQAALDARAAKNGQPAIPYMRENALDGMATRGSGQGFGMEIEFSMDPSLSYADRAAGIQRIARELYDAGLTRTPNQEGYGYSRRFGFVDTQTQPDGTGTWSFERDGSVDGELVTPVMYDEPETWANLEKAVEIIRRNGGVASEKAGAHVHVGTGNYRGSAAAYTELARMVNQHEDVMYRLASDPGRGTHRNNGYSEPLPAVPVAGFRDVSETRRWQRNRGSAVNFGAVSGDNGDHPEFRLFDSTLEPGAMQSQIKVAVAMTHAAQRVAQAGGSTRDREGRGDHVRRNSGETSPPRDQRTAADVVEGSGTARSLLDTLFRRRADKAQLAAVFANTEWAPVGRH